MTYLDIFDQKCLIWVFSDWNLKKIETSVLEVRCKNPQIWNQKCLILLFWDWNFKKLLPYLKSAPSNLSNCKIVRKNKNAKFGTKNALFGYFWAIILKTYCHIWNQYHWICLIAKFCKKKQNKTKKTNLGPKIPYLGIFGLEL